jgi:uncharacterized membrane protein YhaH (DUF805 family)
MRARDLWNWRDPLGRGDYAKWGLLLFAIKYNLDRLLAGAVFGATWYPWSYLLGPRTMPDAGHASFSAGLLLALLLLSLPFIFWGVSLTLRRLRDAGWPAVLLVFFFVPFVNLALFAFLCVQPTKSSTGESPEAPVSWWRRILRTEKPFFAAALGVAMSVSLGTGLLIFGSVFLRDYGWGLFVGTPFMMGFFGALFYSVARVRTWGECALVALASVILVGGLMMILALEGLFCLAMAAPIGLVLALLGATAGWFIQNEYHARHSTSVRLYALAWIALPLLQVLEARQSGGAPLRAVTTVCKIDAAPAVVWRHVVSFSELPPPREKIFLAGIAYPVRARLQGRGVGAVRYCEFSTGPFVEPITVWEENQRLAFDVASQPRPLREWSPYAEIHPAHLDGFFRSRHGEFRLTALPGGGTQLEGTTWYEQSIWPQAYWSRWSDYLVHNIHTRVLTHIKREAEGDRIGN